VRLWIVVVRVVVVRMMVIDPRGSVVCTTMFAAIRLRGWLFRRWLPHGRQVRWGLRGGRPGGPRRGQHADVGRHGRWPVATQQGG
jgi:hypothetical protein